MPANLQIYFRPLLLLTDNSLRVSGILLLPLRLGKDLRILSNSWRLCWRRRYLDRLLILKMTSIYALTELQDRFLLYVSLARPLLTRMPLANCQNYAAFHQQWWRLPFAWTNFKKGPQPCYNRKRFWYVSSFMKDGTF